MTVEQLEIQEKAYQFEKLCLNVLEWAKERDLLHFEYAPKQALKVLEELGEYAGAINKNNPENQIKEFGDVLVTIVVLCGQCIPETKDMRFAFWYEYVQNFENPEMYKGVEIILYVLHSTIQDIKNNNSLLIATVRQSIQYALGYARANNIDAIHCLQTAYDSIKDRKGKMVNGVFVKESDLQEYDTITKEFVLKQLSKTFTKECSGFKDNSLQDAKIKVSIQELKSNLDKLQNEQKESIEYALLCESIKQAKQDLTTLQEKERGVLSKLVAKASEGKKAPPKSFESLLNEQAEMPMPDYKWIDVKEALPASQCYCLVKCEYGFPKDCNVVVAEFYQDSKTFYCEAFETQLEGATHWCFLPEHYSIQE